MGEWERERERERESERGWKKITGWERSWSNRGGQHELLFVCFNNHQTMDKTGDINLAIQIHSFLFCGLFCAT